MAEHDSDNAPIIYVALRYDDARAAIAWLVEAFGFERQMVVEGPEGTIAHAELSIGSGVIMLGSAADNPFGMKSPRALGGVSMSIYVAVEDPDAHYERARAAGAQIARELEDMDYGSREYSAWDLEGHLWSFGTYRPTGGG